MAGRRAGGWRGGLIIRSLGRHPPQPHPTALVFLQTLHFEQGAEGEGGAGFSGSGNSCALLLTGDFTYEVFTVERGSTHGGSVSIAALDLVPWPGEP